MQHIPLKSSNVASVAYDPDTKEMQILFKHGGMKTYLEVPPHALTNIQQCQSPGRFVHKVMMSGKKTVYNDNFHCWKEKNHSDYLDKTWLFAYECGSGCCHGEFESLDEAWEFMAGDSPEMLYVIPPEFPSITIAEPSNKYVSGDPRQTISGQKEPN